MKIYNGDIPFDMKTRSQVHYPEQWKSLVWEPNHEFTGILSINPFYSRGRSAAYFSAQLFDVHSDDDEWAAFLENKTVIIFLSDLIELIQCCTIHLGQIQEPVLMSFCKKGQNYGVTFHFEEMDN